MRGEGGGGGEGRGREEGEEREGERGRENIDFRQQVLRSGISLDVVILVRTYKSKITKEQS